MFCLHCGKSRITKKLQETIDVFRKHTFVDTGIVSKELNISKPCAHQRITRLMQIGIVELKSRGLFQLVAPEK